MDAGQKNYIGLLNECAQKNGWSVLFDLVQTTGPDHIKTFIMTAVLNGKKYPEGSGRNKKEAKQNAAKNAYDILENDETVNTETNLDSSTTFAMVSPANYVCWVNEYSQKRRLLFTTKESSKMGSGFNIQICSYTCKYICGDREFPEAIANNKKEAKEAAAKLVYESLKELEEERGPEENGNRQENQNIQNLSLQNLELSTPTDTEATPTDTEATPTGKNYIGLLNEYCQRKKQVNSFEPVERKGPAHNPEFVYKVVISNTKYSEGRGKTKQEAKHNAARLAWNELHDSDFSQVSSTSAMSESPDNASSSQKRCRNQSKSESIFFTNADSALLDVKPKRQLAANFQNSPVGNKKQSNVNAPKASEISPTDSSQTKSRLLTEFDPDSITNIGRGGQGRVYKAKRKLENKIFAVKIVKFTDKSRREVKALSRFSHANIVRYHTSWIEETEYRDETTDTDSSLSSNSGSHFLYIQMEFCEGKTLLDWINERNDHPEKYPDRRKETATIIEQVLEAVKYIHSKAHIHRDLKPANIMFGHEGGVKVGDFGLVTTYEQEDDGTPLEHSRQVGTPSYMSPEQKQKNYDRKVDIYPLGLVYFELLWQFGTKSERSLHWKNIRRQDFPEDFAIMFDFEHKLIKVMLNEKPEERPEAAALLKKLNQHKTTTASKEHYEEKRNRTY